MFKNMMKRFYLLGFILMLGVAACSSQTESDLSAVGVDSAVAVVEAMSVVEDVSTAVAVDDVVASAETEPTTVAVEVVNVVETESTSAEAEADEADEAPSSAETTSTTYTVDTAASTVGWLGEKIVGDSHNGTLDISEGALVVENGALVSGSFVIDMTSIANENLSGSDATRLIEHLMADDFFGVDTYPTATLEILTAESLGDGQYAVTGELTIKEISNPIEFVAAAVEANGSVTASAEIEFDRTLYDITYSSGSIFSGLGDSAIKDNVQISVSLVATN